MEKRWICYLFLSSIGILRGDGSPIGFQENFHLPEIENETLTEPEIRIPSTREEVTVQEVTERRPAEGRRGYRRGPLFEFPSPALQQLNATYNHLGTFSEFQGFTSTGVQTSALTPKQENDTLTAPSLQSPASTSVTSAARPLEGSHLNQQINAVNESGMQTTIILMPDDSPTITQITSHDISMKEYNEKSDEDMPQVAAGDKSHGARDPVEKKSVSKSNSETKAESVNFSGSVDLISGSSVTSFPTFNVGESTPLPTVDTGAPTPLPTFGFEEFTPLHTIDIDIGKPTPLPKVNTGDSTPLPTVNTGEPTPLLTFGFEEFTSLHNINIYIRKPTALPTVNTEKPTPLPTFGFGEFTPLHTINIGDSTPLPNVDTGKPTPLPTFGIEDFSSPVLPTYYRIIDTSFLSCNHPCEIKIDKTGKCEMDYLCFFAGY